MVILSGLLVGVGMQTKYTAATAVAVIVWYALLHRRLAAGLLAATVAVAVFAGWELYVASEYGQSHFHFHLSRRYGPPPPEPPAHDHLPPPAEPYPADLRLEDKLRVAAPLVGYLGGLAPVVALLLWFGLRMPRPIVRAGAAFVVAGFAAVALVPNDWAVFVRDPRTGAERLSLNSIFVGVNGASFLIAGLAGCAYIGIRGWRSGRPRLRPSPAAWFVVGWFGIELAGYFAMTPFGAARRVMGLVVAGTLLAGFLLRRTRRTPADQRTIGRLTALGVLTGLAFAVVDFADAAVERRAARDVASWIEQQPGPAAAVWFCGHWGFRHYASREGMTPVFPERTTIRAGDWLVVPDISLRPYGQQVQINPAQLQKRVTLTWSVALPVRTVPEYYAGATPFRRHEGSRMRVTVYRARTSFLARTP